MLQQGGIAGDDDAAIEEESAVAVFGETGQPVQPGNLHAAGRERLDQRIGEPLRKLVKRHEAVAGDRPVPAAIAERHAAERDPAGPDRSERIEQRMQDLGCR